MPDSRLLVAVAAVAVLPLLGTPKRHGYLRPSGRAVVLAAAVLGCASSWLAVARGLPVPCAVLAVAGFLAAAREVRRARSRLAAERRRDAAIEACAGLASDLRAGVPPGRALGAAADDWPEFRSVADAAALDADVPAALRRLSDRPGASALRWVAGSWLVSQRSGAGLAAAVDLAVDAMAEERTTARILETELASARATARLLAVLPLGVLLIGSGAGGDPVGFLVGTLPGNVCLFLGAGLAWVGTWWIESIATGISR